MLLKRNGNGWTIDKTYPIGLSKKAGNKTQTKSVTKRYVLLTINNNDFYVSENDNGTIDEKNVKKHLIYVDRQNREILVYSRNLDKLEKGSKVYKPREEIVLDGKVIWFLHDSFTVIENKDIRPKRIAKDYRTPVGDYYIARINPASEWGIDPKTFGSIQSLLLSYPNKDNALEGLKNGIIKTDTYNEIISKIEHKGVPPQNTPLGGYIMIHGGGTSDWTAGCISMRNSDLKELLKYVKRGMSVKII
ncbi:ErfK/YbiS/YcfS/YnhG family protein [Candidatus Magnetoovum chiemensis]|nr:ErfK/YbiS/YcfS/YnhG family protein [Candidatus Magnetoovum chiemensis]